MKFTIDRDLFLKGLRRCDLKGGQIGNAALACVTLDAARVPDSPGGVDLSASNGLLAVATMLAASIEAEGKVAINCKRLMQIVGTMPSGAVLLESRASGEDVDLHVSSGKRKFRERTFPIADARGLPSVTADREVKLPARELARAFGRLSCAVADCGSDHMFRKGLFLDISPEEFNAVVIADHVIATQAIALKTGAVFQGLIPEVALSHASDLAEEEDGGTVTVSQNKAYIWLDNTTTRVMFNPPPDAYLDWRQVIGRLEYTPVCRIPRMAMLESLKALIVAAAKPEAAMWVRLLPTGVLRLDLFDKEGGGDFHDEIPVSDVTGEALPTFMANPRFVLDALQAADLDCVLHCISTGQHIALKSDERYFWAGALIGPDPTWHPPPLEEKGTAAPAAATSSQKKGGGRRPRSDEAT